VGSTGHDERALQFKGDGLHQQKKISPEWANGLKPSQGASQGHTNKWNQGIDRIKGQDYQKRNAEKIGGWEKVRGWRKGEEKTKKHVIGRAAATKGKRETLKWF